MSMTEQEAFEAMYAFLCEAYERTESDDIGSLLGSMSLLPDGKPADPSIWLDWLKCAQRAMKKKVDSDLNFM